jgi:hypothetical protein
MPPTATAGICEDDDELETCAETVARKQLTY